MRSIFKELNINDHQYLTESEMHGVLVRACTERNPISEYIDKTLKKRFEQYKKRLVGFDQEDITLLIERGDISKNVPLAALIWFAARSPDKNIRDIEGKIFNAVHIREHRALRFYDGLCRELPFDGTDKEVISKLRSCMTSNDKLIIKLDRAMQQIDQFKSEIDTINIDKSDLLIKLKEEERLNDELRQKWEQFGGDKALKQINDLKRDINVLTCEIDMLNKELIRRCANKPIYRIDCCSDCTDETCMINDQDMELSLCRRRIALIGGVESLVPSYKETVESLNGIFYHHKGLCSVDRKDIEDFVDKADVLFCPVDINSHNACRYAKKVCKLRNKPCYFLKSSGLTTFKKKLIDFAKDHQNIVESHELTE